MGPPKIFLLVTLTKGMNLSKKLRQIDFTRNPSSKGEDCTPPRAGTARHSLCRPPWSDLGITWLTWLTVEGHSTLLLRIDNPFSCPFFYFSLLFSRNLARLSSSPPCLETRKPQSSFPETLANGIRYTSDRSLRARRQSRGGPQLGAAGPDPAPTEGRRGARPNHRDRHLPHGPICYLHSGGTGCHDRGHISQGGGPRR